MNIIIDATWIASQYGTNNINGGFRVIDNLIRQLFRYPEHTFYLTHTSLRQAYTENLERYLKDISNPSNLIVSAVSLGILNNNYILKIYSKLNKYLPIPSIIPFIGKSVIKKSAIYYSSSDSVPYLIRKTAHLAKFFTALDLLPLVKPDISILFYGYLKNIFDKLTPDIHIFAISNSTKADLMRYRPDLNSEMIKVTYLGADKDIFRKITNEDIINEVLVKYSLKNRKYVLSVNTIAPYKNTKAVVEAFIEYLKEYDIVDLFLVLVGRPLDSNYSELIKSNNLEPNKIIFLERISDHDLSVLYSNAHMFLYMSQYEGFGLPILEALQCGTPTICSNTSSMPEIAGEAAILIDPMDKDELVKSIHYLNINESARDELRMLSIKRAGRFSWEKYADEIVAEFNKMPDVQ